jgi:elongation factor G
MKEYTTDKLRNVVLVGHQSAGKTSLVEALLYNTGAISRMGRIEDKNTASDWDDEEKERGLSLSTSLIPLEFNDLKINLLDTPGYTDFQGELKHAIRVADSVFVVVDAVSGVEVGTELAWQYAEVYQQPIIVTINKMDRENANFEGALASLRAAFPDYKFVPIMLPIGAESHFQGVVNLVTMKAYYGAGAERADLPPELQAAADEARTVLIEAAAEPDDKLIEKYFAEGTLTPDEIRDGMRLAARDHKLKTVPVFVTSGTKNIGTIPLLEAMTVYVSPPSERRYQTVLPDGQREYRLRPQSDEKPLAAFVFKTSNDRFVGTLSYFRIFSGHIDNDGRYLNSTRNADERFSGVMTMRGKEQLPVPHLHAGDIGVVAKLTHTKTGDSISGKEQPIIILRPDFPEPLYQVALLPKTQNDTAKMGTILTQLCDSDPTLRWRQDPDIKQTVLEGMGEAHIGVTISRAAKFGVHLDTEVPRVPYKETITTKAQATYRHRKQTGGAGQFGEVSLRVEPNTGKGYEFRSEVFGGAISSSFYPSIDKGIQSLLGTGVIAGYPIVDVAAVVYDGKEHPVDSKDIAFQIAGREAFKEAFHAAKPVLLEPIIEMKIVVPETMMGDILGDLNTRRARVHGMDTTANRTTITAEAPLAEMMRYGNILRSMTGGRGIYTTTFLRYDVVPSHVAQGIIAAHKPVAVAD